MKGFDTKPGAGSYMESFSLNCEPFADTIDNRFFYGGTTLMQRLDLLSHLTQFGDSVVLVSGPTGSGKTTLLSRFASQANSQWHMCLMNADEFDRFPERLADALKSETAASEQELFSQWAARTDNSQLLVIIIDNSEQLGDDALERLCAFLQQTTTHRVRLILFGEPAAQQDHKQTFERKQLECSTQLLEMPRMSEEETASYLMYRLAVAGYSGENPFTATEIRAICKASDGRPAGINRLARQALLERQARAKSKRVSVRKVRRKVGSLTWGLATAGILALTIWLGWQKFYPPPPDGVPIARTQMEERPLAIPEPAPLKVPTATSPPAEEITVTSEQQATQAPPKEPGLEAEPDPLTTVQTRLNASRTEPAIPDSAIETPLMDGVTDEKPLTPVTEQATTTAVRAAPEPSATTSDKDIVQRPDAPSPTALPTLETAAEPAAVPEQLPHSEKWLLAQPGTSFSLQLLGSRNAESIARYIEQHQLDIRQSAVYKGIYKGAEWYVLLYGIYPSRQAATEARSTLPAAVRSDKPWPRTLKTVHSAIREVQ
jgi:DamX protein